MVQKLRSNPELGTDRVQDSNQQQILESQVLASNLALQDFAQELESIQSIVQWQPFEEQVTRLMENRLIRLTKSPQYLLHH